MIEATDVDALLPKAGGLAEAVKVFLYSLSACNEGKAQVVVTKVEKTPPFIIFDESKIYPEQNDFMRPLKVYLKTVTDGVKDLEELVKKVEEMAKKAEELAKNVKEDVEKSGLTGMDALTAIGNIGLNCKTFIA